MIGEAVIRTPAIVPTSERMTGFELLADTTVHGLGVSGSITHARGPTTRMW